jgi:hypothetical protein
MADKNERKFAQFKLLMYLQNSSRPRTTTEILNHLQEYTAWGRNQVETVPDQGKRNLQNLLKDIRESVEFEALLDCEKAMGDRTQYQYKLRTPDPGQDTLDIEEACCIAMAEKFLDTAMPSDFYDNSLNDLYRRAKATLKCNETRYGPKRRAVKSFVDRVEIAPRGQQLVKNQIPYQVLNTIYSAILDKRCMNMRYRDSPKVMHPYAVIIREPKFYLLGVEDAAMKKSGPEKTHPRLYLCNRIEDANVADDRPNRVPADFNARKFVEAGKLDVGFTLPGHKPGQTFTLKIRIHKGNNDNLILDLEEFPLAISQTISKDQRTENHLLRASNMRATHQLIEWILGRAERIEVLEPPELRCYVADRVEEMHRRYA